MIASAEGDLGSGGLDRRTFFALSAVPVIAAAPAPARRHRIPFAPQIDFLGSTRDIDPLRQLDLIVAAGFDRVEYNRLSLVDVRAAQAFGDRARELGVAIETFVCNREGLKAPQFGDPAREASFLAAVDAAVRLGRATGARHCTLAPGLALPDARPGAQAAAAVDTLRRASDRASSTAIVLLLEPLNPRNHPGQFLTTVAQAAEIVAAVDRPNVRVLFDAYHQQISAGDLTTNARKFDQYIGYFQIADVPTRQEPGTGEVNYTRFVECVVALKGPRSIGLEHRLSTNGIEGLERCFAIYERIEASVAFT